MTKTKLEIIGPYTPEHEGPFCTRDRQPVRLISKTGGSKEYPVIGMIAHRAGPDCWRSDGCYTTGITDGTQDLMNAREVPVAREFWIKEHVDGGLSIFLSKEDVEKHNVCLRSTIHVREVVPGDGE
ncbi:hypothetical protein [Komagataeibacter intermedius]|uniref:Uncharacterized protein n=1 Tax=Komagataeibacter intermedius NRIC 0521 TaxID=1307934 RepID=A0ABQ0PGQ3_9PROT|nr:hypothetical protein [Komagataeibacter intermedius]GAN86394.1 hypothetical protein Gain_0027_069 [Komagataeibacter intermedius TF2]GBQ68091.1 hypothetical protein AA0521_1152 [Komagataeibacter intermedius NRIC 0521]